MNPTRLLLISAALYSVVGEFQLRVLHTNDVHAHVEQSNVHSGRCTRRQARGGRCYGGVARRRTAILTLSRDHENVILVDAGDQFQGTMWFSEYKGSEAAHFMNELGYDVMTLGNHEFDNGVSGLVSLFLERVRFPVVCCNINASLAPELRDLVKNYTLLNVSGELVGVVGYVTTDTAFLTDPGGIANITFLDPIECIQAAVDEFRELGINKIIALGHSGFKYSKKVASCVRGVDLVIDGHTNTFLYNARPPSIEKPKGPYPVVIDHEDGTRTLVYQAYAYGKYLGCADVTFDDDGNVIGWTGNPVLLDSSWQEDEELLADVMEWKKPLLERMERVLAASLVFLQGGRICQEAECNMGDLIADVMLRRGRETKEGSNAGIAFINGGSIRAPIQKGLITFGDLQMAIPIPNTLKIVSLTGSSLRQVLEHSVTEETSSQGHFLQMAGMKVYYDMCQPEGHRVTDVTVLCTTCDVARFETLEDDVIYDVITTNYLVAGGDGFSVLRDNILEIHDLGLSLLAIIEQELITRSIIIQGLTGRIHFLTTPDDCSSDRYDELLLLMKTRKLITK